MVSSNNATATATEETITGRTEKGNSIALRRQGRLEANIERTPTVAGLSRLPGEETDRSRS